MEFFIDTGDLNEIKTAYAWGFVDGVTTNPTLVAKSGKKNADLIKEIEEEIASFLLEMAVKLAALNKTYGEQEAA